MTAPRAPDKAWTMGGGAIEGAVPLTVPCDAVAILL